jgi:hypothetical protein
LTQGSHAIERKVYTGYGGQHLVSQRCDSILLACRTHSGYYSALKDRRSQFRFVEWDHATSPPLARTADGPCLAEIEKRNPAILAHEQVFWMNIPVQPA